MKFRTLGLVAAALFSAHSATASVGADSPRPLRLIAPSAAIPMIAGETAELEWGPLASFLDLPNVEEWEAFLSLDDGATYPIRITPHLDRDLHRITWQVPEFPSKTARLLLRFGDERRETSIEMPHRFVILPGIEGARIAASRSLTSQAYGLGEPARPGEPGVVLWVEGSRRGGDLHRVESTAPDSAESLHGPLALEALDPTAEEAPESGAKTRFAAAAWASAFVPTPSRTAPPEPPRAAIPPLPPLLQTLRSNQ
ncbi:MAG TPA: hypothetical protein VGS22_21045 [Thermoanaerobaculia bacterium]|jgi:hypothetical protein|nr:hypothetical protein [Thermoanaerobaculia bacterium]